jgi:hypothetical protein
LPNSEPVRLRYTGVQATTFQTPGVGHVQPGGEFDVPPSLLLSFMRRGDIEHAGECPSPPCRCGVEAEPAASQAPDSGTSGKPKGGRRGTSPSTQDAQG